MVRIATAATAVWLSLVGALAVTFQGESALLIALAVCVPVAMIWTWVWFDARLRAIRSQIERLADRRVSEPDVTVAKAIQSLSDRQKLTDRALLKLLEGRTEDRTILSRVVEKAEKAAPLPTRPVTGPVAAGKAAPRPAEAPRQPTLPILALEDDATPDAGRDWPQTARALNFPDDATDSEGFRALREARKDRQVAEVLRASEDVLNLLAQDGIYVDDLEPRPTDGDLWLRFAQGERGPDFAALGGIEDRSALSLVQARMRADAVMRDAVLHFLRRYDQFLVGAGADGDRDRLLALADTRTGRAFMLLARAAGTFD
ncbi:MAG: hypothetical protein ACPGID_05360 [Rubricella sp.]